MHGPCSTPVKDSTHATKRLQNNKAVNNRLVNYIVNVTRVVADGFQPSPQLLTSFDTLFIDPPPPLSNYDKLQIKVFWSTM